MSQQPYSVSSVDWPTDKSDSLIVRPTTTVTGPGLTHGNIIELLGINAPPGRYLALTEALNIAFTLGRRAAQSDMRNALGIQSRGTDLTLDTRR
jgi:hypothetical protein